MFGSCVIFSQLVRAQIVFSAHARASIRNNRLCQGRRHRNYETNFSELKNTKRDVDCIKSKCVNILHSCCYSFVRVLTENLHSNTQEFACT